MLSDVKISGACFGQKTQNVGNVRTVKVLIFNPDGSYISVQSVRVIDLSNRSKDR